MPANITDVSTFTAPIVRPTDGDPADAASIATALQGLSNRTRNLANRVGGEDGSTEFAYEGGAKVRYKVLSLANAMPQQDTSGNPLWRFQLLSNVMHLKPLTGAANAFVILDLDVAHQSTLQEIEVWLSTNTGRGTVGDRWQISLWRQTVDGTGPYSEVTGAQLGSTVDDGGVVVGYTKLTLTHSVAIDRQNYQYLLRVKGPDSPGSDDYLHVVRTRFDQPGPGGGF